MDNYEECLEYLGVLFAKPPRPEELKIQNMRKWIADIGITINDIDSLNIIHVTGTKGKGSTCAFTEHILRNRGLKTGLFSSPHTIDVRERIKINGQLISKDKFVKYFNVVYNNLNAKMVQTSDANLAFFSFMTLLAFCIFCVDVAVIEVGIGGLNDSTNIIGRPVVCGVTSIGLDHLTVLGDTVEKIAKNKSGIFKKSVPVLTSPQTASVLKVLFEAADKLECPIKIAQDLDKYPNGPVELGITGKVQQSNASLALQLTRTWQQRMQHHDALRQCTLPGRHQVIKRPNVTYYLDGAHTEESIQECTEWFRLQSEKEAESKSEKTAKILIFNTSLDRNAATFLRFLKTCCFDAVVFCPNIDTKVPEKLNIYNANIEKRKQQQRTVSHVVSVWENLVNTEYFQETTKEKTTQRIPFHQRIPCVRQALCWASQERNKDLATGFNILKFKEGVDHVQVLITGSMHLVGAALGVVGPT